MSNAKVPTISKFGAGFWQHAKRGELALQQCGACGAFVHYPSALCDHCLSTDLEWTVTSGRGTVETFSTVYRAFSGDFAADLPYTVAVVRLEEGPNLLTWIVDVNPEDIEFGMPVEVTFEDINEDIALHRFRPVETPGGPTLDAS